MQRNPIKAYILRELKETNQYVRFKKYNSIEHRILINSPFINLIQRYTFSHLLLNDKLKKLKYHKFSTFKNILVIKNIKNFNKLEKYFNDNGIIWISYRKIKDLSKYCKDTSNLALFLYPDGFLASDCYFDENEYNKNKEKYHIIEEKDFYQTFENFKSITYKEFINFLNEE